MYSILHHASTIKASLLGLIDPSATTTLYHKVIIDRVMESQSRPDTASSHAFREKTSKCLGARKVQFYDLR